MFAKRILPQWRTVVWFVAAAPMLVVVVVVAEQQPRMTAAECHGPGHDGDSRCYCHHIHHSHYYCKCLECIYDISKDGKLEIRWIK